MVSHKRHIRNLGGTSKSSAAYQNSFLISQKPIRVVCDGYNGNKFGIIEKMVNQIWCNHGVCFMIVDTKWQHCIHFRFLTKYIIILRLWNDPFPFLLSRRCIETQWTRGNFSSKIMMTKWWEVLLLFLWLSWNRVLTEKVELRESYLKLHAVVAALMYLIHSM